MSAEYSIRSLRENWKPTHVKNDLRILKDADYKQSKVKSIYLTSVVPSVTELVSMEADGAPFTPSLCQCSFSRIFKAIATRIRAKWKQTLKFPRMELGTPCSESRAVAN